MHASAMAERVEMNSSETAIQETARNQLPELAVMPTWSPSAVILSTTVVSIAVDKDAETSSEKKASYSSLVRV